MVDEIVLGKPKNGDKSSANMKRLRQKIKEVVDAKEKSDFKSIIMGKEENLIEI